MNAVITLCSTHLEHQVIKTYLLHELLKVTHFSYLKTDENVEKCLFFQAERDTGRKVGGITRPKKAVAIFGEGRGVKVQ